MASESATLRPFASTMTILPPVPRYSASSELSGGEVLPSRASSDGEATTCASRSTSKRRPSFSRSAKTMPNGMTTIANTNAVIVRYVRSRRLVTASTRRIEPVPDSPESDDPVGVPELAAQRCDVNVERLGRTPPVLVPNPGDDLLAGPGDARFFGE